MHAGIHFGIGLAGLLFAATALAATGTTPKAPAPQAITAAVGSVTPIRAWTMQSSAKAQQGGAEISSDGFAAHDWYPVTGRATVMAGLLENGKYAHVFYSDNLRAVGVPDAGHHQFVIPWWYRTQFTLPAAPAGTHTLIRTNGMNASADLWINGHEVATRAAIAGSYPVYAFDVTKWVHAGTNTLALRVHPGDPQTDFLMGWVDWNPAPPDNNMGPWRGVDIVRTGPVQLRFPDVTSKLALPGLASAALTVRVEVRNLDDIAHTAIVAGTAAGVTLKQSVELAPGQTRSVEFSPKTDPALVLQQPKVWWPVPMGAHPLYQLDLTAKVAGAVSDRVATTFGVRSVTSHLTPQGYRQFVVNGKPVLIRGGGWAPDMFLRENPQRLNAEFEYVRNMGLNAIRSEGKLEDARFYDLADKYGIMILPGWECCNKWESAAKTGGAPWDANDFKVAGASMASEARLLRNHPSVIGFLIGSDNAPPAATAKMYVDTLRAEHWQTPIVSAASDQATAIAGPSGMKMDGPYAWVPPAYWYGDKLGAAFGFDSEVSAGADIPRLADVKRMLSPQEQEALWKYPQLRQFHATAAWSPFASLARFDTALAHRYGAPTSLADYVQKAQLANYANTRAQFEAFNANMDAAKPSTGVIYWMLNNAWPSLHWHLYDYYMNPAGAFFGAKKANEPVHIQYSYTNREVVLVNHTLTAERGLRASIKVRDLDGSVRFSKDVTGIDLAGNHTLDLLALPQLAHLSSVYFVELELDDVSGKPVSRNVYWLPTQTDVLDWAKSNWYMTPVTRYADLTALQSLPQATVRMTASTARDGADAVTTVVLSAPKDSKSVAFFEHLTMMQPGGGGAILPVRWSDNDVTLWPGESLTLTARYAAGSGTTAMVRLRGNNVAPTEVPATGASAATH